jgi:hypothetical protein
LKIISNIVIIKNKNPKEYNMSVKYELFGTTLEGEKVGKFILNNSKGGYGHGNEPRQYHYLP